jgi:branched-chain amino acid transport system ATP-binding protein
MVGTHRNIDEVDVVNEAPHLAPRTSHVGGEPLFEMRGVDAGYGPISVLRSVSLAVHPGEIVTLIGANGAGKTTTLMCASGIHRVAAGRVRFLGEDIHGLPACEIVRRGLAQVPEGRKIFPRLSVLENLRLGAFTRRDAREIAAGVERAFALFPILGERRHQAGGTLSGGEQQMLAIGRALMSRPRMLLMDEPSMGVAPLLVLKIFATIRELNREGLAVLLVEQNARLALKLAGRGYVMETGAVVLEDRAERLLVDPRVREAYLGEGPEAGNGPEVRKSGGPEV